MLDLTPIRIAVTGAGGFVGGRVAAALRERGCAELLTPSRADCNLLDGAHTSDWMASHRPDVVVHCAAATENFMVLENHSVDQLDQWSQLVEGLPVPLIEDGHIAVPEAPGLGFSDLNEDVLREFADPDNPQVFASTEAWDGERASDRLWS